MSTHPIHSIGHGTREIGAFISLLKTCETEYLADLRSVPYSKFNPQYNRPPLVMALEKAGIRYVYMGDQLGGRPADPACYDRDGRVDYERIRHQYFFRAGIDRLKQAWSRGLKITLLCSESRPDQCHRSRLVGRALAEEQIFLRHIDGNGAIQHQKQLVPLTATPAGLLLFP